MSDLAPSGIEMRIWARTAGISYLLIFVCSITANFFVFERLLVPGQITETMTNIQQHEALFRWGIVLWLLTMVFDTLVAWALYYFFKATNDSWSMLAAMLRIIFLVVFCYSILADHSLLQLCLLDEHAPFYQQQGEGLLQNAYYAVRISYLFFGLHIAVIGLLTRRSGHFPMIISILLFTAAGGYVVDSMSNFLFPAYRTLPNIFMMVVGIPALFAELSLTIWLLIRAGRSRLL
ncbi:MAG TPA: DUF4386 domain-containing protein [Cyclobacteriaceae bacterium]|nr:DUF4386 domain-containing protein [Cyclobacteriaceae bacterium]